MTGGDAFGVAGRLYPWKPSLALGRAAILDELARAGVALAPPVLDLGCGDGMFARAMAELGLLERVDVGADWDIGELRAMVVRPRLGAVRADLAALPFAEGSFGSVLCVTVLSSLLGGPEALERAAAELGRVLRPGGVALVAVATTAFAGEAWAPKALLRLGLAGAAGRFGRWMNERNDHYHLHDEAGWTGLLARAGLEVEACRYPLTGSLVRLQSWVAAVPGADLPRRLGWRAAERLEAGVVGGLLSALGGRAARAEAERPDAERRAEARYLLLVARRPSAA